MPRVNLYIRKEDEAKWAELPNRSEFIHNALNQPKFRPLTKDDKAVLSLPMVVEDFPKPAKLCKHGNPKGSCSLHKEASLKCNV